VRVLIEMPVVRWTYVARADVTPDPNYEEVGRYEYDAFPEGAPKAAVPKYLHNPRVYGYLPCDKNYYLHVEHGIERASELLRAELDAQLDAATLCQHTP